MSEDDINPELQDGRQEVRERYGYLKTLVRENFKFLVLIAIAYLTLAAHGILPVPEGIDPKPLIFIIGSLGFGRIAVGRAITALYGDRFKPDGNDLKLDSKTGVCDRITVPQGTFAEYTVLGDMPTTRTITGERTWRIRAIDTENKILVPAGTFPNDDETPDDYKILAEEGDLREVDKLENKLLEYAEAGRKQQVSKEVLKEQAMNEVTKEFAKSMMEIRDSGADLEEMSDSEIEAKANEKTGEIIQKFAESEGEEDEQ